MFVWGEMIPHCSNAPCEHNPEKWTRQRAGPCGLGVHSQDFPLSTMPLSTGILVAWTILILMCQIYQSSFLICDLQFLFLKILYLPPCYNDILFSLIHLVFMGFYIHLDFYFVYSVKLYMCNQLSQNYPPLPLSELYQVSIYTWVCFWAHYSVPLLCLFLHQYYTFSISIIL